MVAMFAVRGFAGTNPSFLNYGVIPVTGGTITSGGNGNVPSKARGRRCRRGQRRGYSSRGIGTITSGGTGTVTVTGTGGPGNQSYGEQQCSVLNGTNHVGRRGCGQRDRDGDRRHRAWGLHECLWTTQSARILSGGGSITVTGTSERGLSASLQRGGAVGTSSRQHHQLVGKCAGTLDRRHHGAG